MVCKHNFKETGRTYDGDFMGIDYECSICGEESSLSGTKEEVIKQLNYENKMDEENKLQSVIYLEDRCKKQDRELINLRNSLNEAYAEVGAQKTIIESLEKTNERLLKTIENSIVK